ncbi:KAT8 regulatory NSL complex subunit 3 [Orchesella cincta]|uniref:KAT8 regulatory NSL complex subunit 3 n=1 Tax=Orchesella cincta TaxID=48709 RepID=A0A1D2ND52_ORCCI|nr:KAT8 regulatory NSL complex subunit 3 [Orchesella cincta]
MASLESSKDGHKAPSISMDNIKPEPEHISPVLPVTPFHEKANYKKTSTGLSSQSHVATGGEKPRIKRPYNKKRTGDYEKPPPKKRGRKSKKELSMIDMKEEDVDMNLHQMSTKISRSKKSPSQQKINRKTSTVKPKKTSVTAMGPSVFDKKILAGPHLTMKQVLEYIITDHSYCVPPDPLPAVSSNHQMIRSILGPRNVSKPRALQMMTMDSCDRSPIVLSNFSRSRGQLNLPSTPPTSSKLENLLKRGDASPVGVSMNSMRFSHSRNTSECRDESDIEIDVESVEPEKRVPYDTKKAIDVMKECEKYVEFARSEDTGNDWESKILKTGWTKAQSGLFDKIVSALHAERLARLTYERIGDAEPVLRRASIDRTASRVRRILGEYLWDSKLTQWLHGVLTESLNYDYLAVYLDVLQTLKSRCPQLVSRMMTLSVSLPLQQAGREDELVNILTPFLEPRNESGVLQTDGENNNNEACDQFTTAHSGEHENAPQTSIAAAACSENDSEIYLPERSVVPQMQDVINKLNSAKHAEALKALLERQWDPFAPVLLHRMKKLAANPVFLLIAPSAIYPKHSLNRRLRQYHDMFRRIGKIVTVSSRHFDARNYTSASTYIERIMYIAKEKVRTIRSSYPDRPLYVVGWGSGSILAARLSNMVGPVDGIVALGFPLHSVKRMQEDLHKVFSGLKHPVLFVIGGLASNNSLTDMELFRRRLPCETSLVVVGSGNENLYLSRAHREKLLTTQSYVDKTIMDEIAYFVNLHSKHNQTSATITTNISMKSSFPDAQRDDGFGKRFQGMSRGRKRSISSTSFDVEPLKNEDRVVKPDGEKTEMQSPSTKMSLLKKEADLIPKSPVAPYDYDFDEPSFIPSNKSSNKRKAYSSRPIPSTASSPTISNSLTASKLLQQSPNVKRRMSKPSGPTQRVPMLAQQGQRNSTPSLDPPNDDPAGLLKYLNNKSSQEVPLNDIKQEPGVVAQSLPIVLRQPDVAYPPTDSRILGTTFYSKDAAVTTASSIVTKSGKKKSNSKSKSVRISKTSSTESPSIALAAAITDVSTPGSSGSTPTPASSLDMHKYVLQHKQMIKQLEQHRQDNPPPPPQTSQLFKLLSPGGDSDSISPVSSLPYAQEYVKLKLIGSQPVTPSDLVAGEARTAVISKQNLVTNMAIPMIRLSTSKPDEGAPKPIIMTAPSSSLLTNLSAGDSGERIFVRATDKGLVKLNPTEIKNLIAGSRGIQVVSGVSGLTTQTPLVVKSSQDSSEPVALPSSSSEPLTIAAVSSIAPNDTPSIELSALLPETAAPSLQGVPSLTSKQVPSNEVASATKRSDVPSTVINESSLTMVDESILATIIKPSVTVSNSVSSIVKPPEVPDSPAESTSVDTGCATDTSITHPSSSVLPSVSGNSAVAAGLAGSGQQLESKIESSTAAAVPASEVLSNTLESVASSLPVSNESATKDTQKLTEENLSKDDSNCTEDQVETEPEDTDDEMSGLCISSTFSMCPTSGERVDPPEAPSSEVSQQPTDPKKSSKSEKPDVYRSKLRPRRSTSSFDPY